MTAQTTGGSAADQARETAQQVSGQAKDKAQQAGEQARGRVRDEVDRRSTQAGEQAGSAAEAMRQASQQLREQGNEPVAKGMEQVADRFERAGGWLRDSDGDSILGDVEDFGRRNPMAVAAAGVAIGFAASRLLKASSRRRYESAGTSGDGAARLPASTSGVTETPAVPATSRVTGPPPPSPSGATAPPPPPPGAGVPTTLPGEGLTDAGLTGGTPATSPPGRPGGLGGEGEGARGS